jgi:hypothetical protein
MRTWKTLLILSLIVLLSIIYSYKSEKIRLSSNNRMVKREILKQISIGSPISDAQAIMQKNGFECSMRSDDSFIERNEVTIIAKYEGIDYLSCYKDGFAFPICEQRWQIALVQHNYAVTDILVAQGTSCL